MKTERIEAESVQLRKLATETETVRRLQTMPGVGPLTALGTVEAFAPDMVSFKRGRDFAAWLGLVTRQHSSGGCVSLGIQAEGPSVCSIVKSPTAEEEDRRRVVRERKVLIDERMLDVNCLKGLLFSQGTSD